MAFLAPLAPLDLGGVFAVELALTGVGAFLATGDGERDLPGVFALDGGVGLVVTREERRRGVLSVVLEAGS